MRLFARRLAFVALLLGFLAPSAAGNSAPFEQLRHFAWQAEDGSPTNIQGIAQSPDGFIWLASATGLYRFDGVSFERIPLEGGDDSQSLQVASVAAAPNGDIWIGYDWGGMAVYRGGHLRAANPVRPDKASVYVAVTRDGALWARTTGRKGNRLVRFKDGRWTDIDASWNLPIGTNSIAMLVSRDGSFYLVNPDGIRRLRPGARRFEFQPLEIGYGPTIGEDQRGRIWIADADRLFRVEFGKGRVGPVTPLPHSNLYRRLAFDTDNAAWLAGTETGVYRLLPDRTGERYRTDASMFDDQKGLSSPVTLSMLRDSEENIWVGTLLGIDRFSARRAIKHAGLPLSYVFDTFAGANREAYLIANNSLWRVGKTGPEELTQIRGAETICGDKDGIVVATPSALFAYANGGIRTIPLPQIPGDPEPRIYACAFDPEGRLLLSVGRHPLYRREGREWRPVAPALPEIAYGFLPAPGGGTLAVYPKDRIVRIAAGKMETLWSASQGSIGFIKTAAAGRKCTLFGAQNGLGCLAGKKMKLLSAATYPQLTNVSGIVETPQGWTWLIALPGIMRVRTDELDAAFDAPGRSLSFQSFGAEDGFRGETMMMHPRNVIADRFGRLWFFTTKGLVSLDLAGVEGTPRAPRVVIKSLTSNGRKFPSSRWIELPVGTRDFQVDYTATALTDPKGTTFRYMLEGIDTHWNEAGDRRQAFYTNLSPGRYRFRLSAVSSAGISSRDEAFIDVEIKPRFFQTRTFAVVCIALLLLFAILLYRWRLHSLAVRLGERMQERLEERERIARELHDTLLQGVSGLLLQFQSLAARVGPDQKLRDDMEAALDRAENLVVEGRNRVRNLRAGDGPRDLEETLALALTQPGFDHPIKVKMERTGSVRPVTGAAAEELAAIAAEAMSNSIRHGRAKTLTVTMSFHVHGLDVAVEDDGVGIAQEIATAGERPGHFGLIGMRERAKRLQGTLNIASPKNGGTRITISVPSRCAYLNESGFFRRICHRG